MKKIFLLLTLALLRIGTAWADVTPLNAQNIVQTTLIYTSATNLAALGYAQDGKGTQVYSPPTSDRGSALNPEDETQDNYEIGLNSTFLKNDNSNKQVLMYVSNVTKVEAYVKNNKTDAVRKCLITATPTSGTATTAEGTTGTGSEKVTLELDYEKSYTLSFTSPSGDISLYAIRLTSHLAAPYITTQPASATYAIGSTAEAMTVEAVSSSGNLTYKWYSCSNVSKGNETEIDGATTSSFIPSTATIGTFYYFCRVTDDNSSTDTNVARIVVKNAVGPSISITSFYEEEYFNYGAEVTLTATVEGLPTPTIQWYSNTQQSNSGGIPIEGATGTTFHPSTTTSGYFYYYAVATNSEGSKKSACTKVGVRVADPVLPYSGWYCDKITMTCATEGATIYYNADGSWKKYTEPLSFDGSLYLSVYASKDGCPNSETESYSYNYFDYDKEELQTVGDATTWDWSSWQQTLEITYSYNYLYNQEYTYNDIIYLYNTHYNQGEDITIPNDFYSSAITFRGQYPVRNNCAQAGTIRINVAHPGSIEVTFSNTGGSNSNRFLQVTNRGNIQRGTVEAVGTTKRTETFKVLAGDVIITGVPGPGGDWDMLRYYSIKYTPVKEVTGVITASGYNTYSCIYPLDLSTITGGTAYVASSVNNGKAVLMKCTDKVDAGTGIMIAGEADTEFTIGTASDDATFSGTNLLVGMPEGGKVSVANEGFNYVFGWTDIDDPGFYKVVMDEPILPANKAYLHTAEALGINSEARLAISLFDSETTGIETVNNTTSTRDNAIIYNLNGQRMAQPQKGIVIVNGQKRIIK